MQPGSKLGHDEIRGPIGKGDKGEVSESKDTKLGRNVVIKSMPEGIGKDAARLAPFEREATLLASRIHANIAAIDVWGPFIHERQPGIELRGRPDRKD
jgi:serine/threonine protein kinase